MLKRKDIFEFISERYNIKPDYPWKKYSDYAALRHRDNEKWFALIMNITGDKIGLDNEGEIDVLNLKAREEFIGPLRKQEGIYKAYHMDKSNWITINLNEINSINSIKDLIAESFELTA